MAARIDEHSFYLGPTMPKRRRRNALTTPILTKSGTADPRLLRMIARMLRSLADQLDRLAGP
jgi:hypothetical protein